MHYLHWLQDSSTNTYLETRWIEQSSESIRDFVSEVNESSHSLLLGIFLAESRQHIGNIKLGPINNYHKYADVSYFIGAKESLGKGYATEAVSKLVKFGFEKLGLFTIQAGVYSGNLGSIKVLERSRFSLQAKIEKKLIGPSGREDHLIYSVVNEDLEA